MKTSVKPQKRAKKMTTRIGSIVLTGMLIFLTGCASEQTISPQIVTKTMVLAQDEPKAPDPNSTTQREIAVYIVNLRAWGRMMHAQLDNVYHLLDEPKK